MLDGPDLDGLTAAAARSTAPVIASGGVSSLADIEALAKVPGIAGVITGKALYEGRFTIADALRAVRR
jgi:phosphoribosylformimino-5-aminoimidazole carboxamide ribonucleotide (ProFAR) isomerase